MSDNKYDFIVGLDVGRSAVKVSYEYRGKRGSFFFPSNVCLAHSIAYEETALEAKKHTVEVDGQNYFVGQTAKDQGSSETQIGMSDNWINSPHYKALVMAAVRYVQARILSDDVPMLVIGTPSATYDLHKTLLAKITKEVINTEIKVIPQPSGAYFDYILNDKGNPLIGRAVGEENRSEQLSYAVIEMGHYTTDFIMMLRGQVIEKSFDSTVGISSCIKTLKDLLTKNSYRVNDNALQDALVTGQITQYGKKFDVSEQIKTAVAPVVQGVISKSEALFDRNVESLDGIILAGGGAVYAYEALRQKWPHVIMAENPRLSIANGFLKYGIGLQNS